jgi:hypothetical protein
LLSVSSRHQQRLLVVVADSAEQAAAERVAVEVRHSVQPAVPGQRVERVLRVVPEVLLAERLLLVLEQQSVAAVYSDRPH